MTVMGKTYSIVLYDAYDNNHDTVMYPLASGLLATVPRVEVPRSMSNPNIKEKYMRIYLTISNIRAKSLILGFWDALGEGLGGSLGGPGWPKDHPRPCPRDLQTPQSLFFALI